MQIWPRLVQIKSCGKMCMVVQSLGRQRQEGCRRSEASLAYIASISRVSDESGR